MSSAEITPSIMDDTSMVLSEASMPSISGNVCTTLSYNKLYQTRVYCHRFRYLI